MITVFGCGGNRDRAKRPEMGRIAARRSHVVIVTSDNPRNEDPEAILRDIVPGIVAEGFLKASGPVSWEDGYYTVIPDRKSAIARALQIARPGDTVAIAGKGHENVQLIGERGAGADYVEEAIRKGARAAIVSEEGARKVPHEILAGKPVFVVRNSVEALGDRARAHRERLRHIPLVGITGSSGKTSTKEMLAALLFRSRKVLKNPGNRNNLIGLPLALLELSGDHDVAVLEMGTNHPGEIARLSAISAPDVAVITNIAPAHLKGLGSLEGVAREKGEIRSGC